VDVSAWVRYPCPEVAARLDGLAAAGVLATCSLVELQLLAGLEDQALYATVATLRRQAFPVLDMCEADAQRALEVQASIAEIGRLTVPGTVLFVAAIAERHGVALLHGSRCFDPVVQVTGQPAEQVEPPWRETRET
jgi:predicted nucleic acid-binding protein